VKKSAKKNKQITPLMDQYFKLKAKNPDAIMLFRVGDFYETFGEDAIQASQVLGIVLTSRNNGGSDIELAGFPHHSLNTYLPKLIRAGYRVALCEQLEKPSKEKKIVKRGITDVITPGVTIDDAILENKANNYLCSVYFTGKGHHGIAFLDVSTGEFLISEGNMESIIKLVESFSPSEILHSKQHTSKISQNFGDKYYTYALDEWIYSFDYAREQLLEKFKVKSLKGFGIEAYENGQIAAGSILHYLASTQNDKLDHISNINRIQSDHFVWLDRFTIRNLELVHSVHETGKSLLSILDQTSSPMGARMMRKWILMPLLSIQKINPRLDVVEYFTTNESVTLNLDATIKSLGDLERIISKVSMERINPRELIQLKKALLSGNEIKKILAESTDVTLKAISDNINPCQSAVELVENCLVDEPPTLLSKGNVIRHGYNATLDELTHIVSNSKEILLEIQQKESEATGISNLKIGYNSVFGYYLEVTNKYKDQGLIPDHWVRKQTLTNAERYISDELKQIETKILGAEEKITALEEELYNGLVTSLAAYVNPVQQNATTLGQLDCLISFAKVSSRYRYNRPEVNDSLDIHIEQGRHPVIEQQLPIDQEYVPNDIILSNDDTQIKMITGPNMSGKSAVLRQTALISLMAQIGCFVPAQKATLGIIDKIFTRVGASDNISSGESTFMLEMNETASIMNNISERSLILLDEIGRGTSTYDGISIAWSLAEFLHDNPTANPKTLFATHYHELNELANKHPRIKNYNVATKEVGNKVIFLRKLEEGGCEHSFGIHVAAMAGMPKPIIERAAQILSQLEKKSIEGDNIQTDKQIKDKVQNLSPSYQLSIFETVDPAMGAIKEAIQQIELNTMTPIDCMMKLNELKKMIEDS
jgi:DNA mismatch repair protein MutS